MNKKILKAVGCIILAIGIIGGLSTIGMIFNGNIAIWIILVISFCGIGIISLSVSNVVKVNNAESEEINTDNTERNISKSTNSTDKRISYYTTRLYYLIKEQMVRIDQLYFKVILTIIAILLLIIAVELNDKLSEIAFEIYRK